MRSKKYQETAKLVDQKKLYTIEEAIDLVKKTSKTKFDATIEVHFHLGINPEKGEQQVRGVLSLPHSAGKAKIIAAFVEAGREAEAKEAGATLVGGEELIAEIAKSGKCDFEVAVATPAIMPKLAKVAKILGPRGLMPNPKNETVGLDIKKIISELKKGKTVFKNDLGGNIHIVIGKVSSEKEKLLENFRVMLETVKRTKPPTSKGIFLQSITLASSMGPGIPVQV